MNKDIFNKLYFHIKNNGKIVNNKYSLDDICCWCDDSGYVKFILHYDFYLILDELDNVHQKQGRLDQILLYCEINDLI